MSTISSASGDCVLVGPGEMVVRNAARAGGSKSGEDRSALLLIALPDR